MSLALAFIGELYETEADCRENRLSPADRKEYRLNHALPVKEAFLNWLKEYFPQVLPKSSIGKAMSYAMTRWEQLSNYLKDGMLEIDKNAVENIIRPVALGRKKLTLCRITPGRTAGRHDLFLLCHPDARDR